MQLIVTFVEKDSQKVLLKIKFIKHYRQARNNRHFTGKYRGAAHSIFNLKFHVPNEILVVFHIGSNNDYHFIIKELANSFEGKFDCLREITEKY